MGRLKVALTLLLLFLPYTGHGQTDQSSLATRISEPATEITKESPKFDLTPDANGNISQEQMRQLFRIVADKDQENDRRLRDYTYIERDVEKRLDGKGQVKSTETKTYEVMEIYGEQVNRLIAKDDKPLSEKDAAKEEEKIRKVTDKRKNESEDDRRKREAKEEKEREDGRKFVNEVADAYNFKLVGTEPVGGREAWVIDAEPRPEFVPHMKESKFLSKFRGRVWVDKTDLQLARIDAEALDTLTFGLFLARLHKGAHFAMEQTRVNDEVWLPLHLTYNVDARIALLKNFRIAGEQTFRDYKKFRSSTKIVGYEEVKQP
ncbi:MAG TPA: hypothetical protein VG897_10645 [Terriglobales bacterium]|nr:hypothetical protein [Terriglobales bacterium]